MPFILTASELFDMFVMTIGLGFIFKDAFVKPRINHDPLKALRGSNFNFEGMKFAMMVVAPAIILHEVGHKIAAISFGLQATFNAAYGWLGLGVLLKLMNFGFIFFVPAYVSIVGVMTPLTHAIVAFAGPAVHLTLWLGSAYLLTRKDIAKKRKFIPWLVVSKKINMFLFIFNMLPFPFFDGFKVFQGIIQTLS